MYRGEWGSYTFSYCGNILQNVKTFYGEPNLDLEQLGIISKYFSTMLNLLLSFTPSKQYRNRISQIFSALLR